MRGGVWVGVEAGASRGYYYMQPLGNVTELTNAPLIPYHACMNEYICMYEYYLIFQLGEVMVVCCRVCVTQHGMTPLLFASQNGHVDVVNALLATGANKDARNNVGGDGDRE